MRKLLFAFIFISLSLHCQEHSFIAENNQVKWLKIFEGDSNAISHPKLKKGHAKNIRCMRCKKLNTSIFLNDEFSFDYIIEQKDNRYRVTVTNIIFQNSTQIEVYNVRTSDPTTNIEEYITRNKDGNLRGNKIIQNTLKCLEITLKDIFTPRKENDNDW